MLFEFSGSRNVLKMGRIPNKKNVSFEKRQLVIFHYEKGNSYRKIGEMLRLSKSMVGDIVQRYKNEDRILPKKQTGRPKLLNDRDNRFIMKEVYKNPKISEPKVKALLKKLL